MVDGDIQGVKSLLAWLPSHYIRFMRKHGDTILSSAVKSGRPGMVVCILDHWFELDSPRFLSWERRMYDRDDWTWSVPGSGVEYQATDKDGRTSLSWAAGNGQPRVVDFLLGTRGCGGIEEADRNSRIPLDWAVDGGHFLIVEKLLGVHLYTIESWLKIIRSLPPSTLMGVRAMYGSLVVRGSYDKYVDLPWDKRRALKALLLIAAGQGWPDVLDSMLILISDLWIEEFLGGSVTSAGACAVMAAINSNQEHGLIALVKHGRRAVPEISQWWEDILKPVLVHGHERVIEMLQKDDGLLMEPDTLGQTPLYFAARDGVVAIMEKILESKVDPEPKRPFGEDSVMASK